MNLWAVLIYPIRALIARAQRGLFRRFGFREPKMDRLRPAMLIAALVVDVGRRLPRRGGSAMPPSARLIRV